MSCLDEIRTKTGSLLDRQPSDAAVVRGIWRIDCLFQPDVHERLFKYVFIIAQTVRQGAAYTFCEECDREQLVRMVGRDYREISFSDPAVEIAILDSIWASHIRPPTAAFSLCGHTAIKAKERAVIVAAEAVRLGSGLGRKIRVAQVGVVGHIVAELTRLGCEVVPVDLDPLIVGTAVHGAVVRDGCESPLIVADADVALITGMTLSNGTLDRLLQAGHDAGTKLLIFAESGSSFAEFYISMGVDAVVSEPVPFYIFQGTTSIGVYRR